MSVLRDADVKWLLRKMPATLRSYAELAERKVFIAGGFIRAVIAGEVVNDVDVFTDSNDSAQKIAMAIRGGETLVTTPNAITVRSTAPVVQIITRWTFTKLSDCIESFDFTIARAGLTFSGGSWGSFCDDNFYSDLAAKRLRYRAPDRMEDEAGSMLRMLKFYGRGYRAPLYDIAAVVARSVKGIEVAASSENARCEFVLGRLRVIDPSADPEDEGHLG